jgi:RNA polymerase sigma-70 factor, ECF subfamily
MQTVQASTIPRPAITTFSDDLLKTIPKLRAYAISLCRTTERGDDLAQETLVKAWTNASGFEPGTNLVAWLYAIMRNEFYSQYRKRRREVEDNDGRHANLLRVSPSQEKHIHLLDVRDAMNRLTAEHREALTLSVSGLSYEEAAAVCGCAVGTMKSRTSRARDKLARMLDDHQPWISDDSPFSGASAKIANSDGALAF